MNAINTWGPYSAMMPRTRTGAVVGKEPEAAVLGESVLLSAVVSPAAPAPAPAASAPVVPNPWPELERLGLLAGASAVPGPIGTVLNASARQGLLAALERLESAGITFERQRGLRVPFVMKKYVPLTADEVLKELEEQPATLKKKINANGHGLQHLRVETLDHLRALDTFYGLGTSVQPADKKALAEALQSLEAAGVKLNSYGSYDYGYRPVTPAEAFLALSAGRARVYTVNANRQDELRNAEDILALDYFDGSGQDRGLKEGAAAAGLKALEAKKHTFKVGDSYYEQTAYAAYRALASNPKQRLHVLTKGSIGTAASIADLANLPALEQRMAAADALYKRFVVPVLQTANLDERYGQGLMDEINGGDGKLPTDLRAAVTSEVVRAHLARHGSDGWNGGIKAARRLLERSGTHFEIAQISARYATLMRKGAQGEAEAMLEAVDGGLRKMAADESEAARLQDIFTKVLDSTGSVTVSMEALDLVRIPVGAETDEQRLSLFLDVARNESESTLWDTPAHYRAILVHRLPSETLPEAGAKMIAVLHALSVGRQQEKAGEVFAALQIGMRNGRFGSMTGDEVVQRFTEALAITGSAEKALDSIRSRQAGIPAGPGTVQQDDDFVVIGGVKVPKTQG